MQKNLLVQSIKDFFTPTMLKISFVPFLLSMILLYGLFFGVADMGLDALKNSSIHTQTTSTTMIDGIPHTSTEVTNIEGGELQESDGGIISFLMTHSLTSWLVSFFVYTIGSIFTLLFSVMLAVIIVGFLTPMILKTIQKKHYPQVEIEGFGGVSEGIFYLLKSLFVMLILLFVLTPLYFIPLLNIVAFNLPFYYFFHKMINFDVGSTLCSRKQFAIINVEHKTKLKLVTLSLFALSLVPFVALFASAFFIIYLGHHYFSMMEIEMQDNPELLHA